ncbi:hypothetical protein JCM3765_007245 [Sporobolomyces pararoseus]
MVQMKAILVRDGKSETADGLYMGDFEKPTLKKGDGNVIVKVKAFGLNRMDIMQRRGQYPLPPGTTPVMGVEFSGTIEDAGESDYKIGDEVFGLAIGGAYAEFIKTPCSMLTLKPTHVSWVQAAAVPENWLTAFQALFTISEFGKAGKTCLIHAGCSGVGLAAIQLAKAYGAELVIATAGTDEKVKFVEQHGAKGINYKTQDFSEQVLKLTDSKGVDVLIDFIGASYWEKNLKSLARDGRMVLLGLMGGAKTETPLDLSQILFKRLRIEGTTLRSRTLEYQGKLLQDFSKEALGKVFAKAKGEEGLDLVIHKVYDWKDIKDAHVEMEQAKNIGKIVCEIK